jgi:hypothetical protein
VPGRAAVDAAYGWVWMIDRCGKLHRRGWLGRFFAVMDHSWRSNSFMIHAWARALSNDSREFLSRKSCEVGVLVFGMLRDHTAHDFDAVVVGWQVFFSG